MGRYLALRDLRLSGGVPARPKLIIINCDATSPLVTVFHQIKSTATHAGGRINAMFVLCHGYAGYDLNARVSMDAGGMGLQLGREGIRHSNVAAWRAISGAVDNIVVYACAAADTQPDNVGTTADGKYLMGALAIYTGAAVYAADRIQWYNTYHGLKNGAYNFGIWEGQLWLFPPDGTPPTKVFGAPIEFDDVVAGHAP